MSALTRRIIATSILAMICPCRVHAQVALVRPADLGRLTPAAFRDDEVDLPFYLANFHRIANSVALEGPKKGFIDIPVWRNATDNQPHNARIMENILSLAYFYCTDRPWNPYRGDPALRARLEAALDFWVRSQNDDGRFSEYAPKRWGLAPTAFATKFMGEALRLLKNGPPIDSALHRRAIEADRKAIMAVFTRSDLAEHGRSYTNQFSNAFAGALAYLALYPDPAMERALRDQVALADRDHQSVVGFFYEAGGPDWGYNLNTHVSNFHMAWHYTHGTPLGRMFSEPMRKWFEWFAYNAVPEPGSDSLTLNRGVETRQHWAAIADAGPNRTGNPIAEVVPAARVLGPTKEGLTWERAAMRAKLVREWPRVDTLQLGSFSTFSPYAFLHRSQIAWNPTDRTMQAARAVMRPVVQARFTHQRVDTRLPTVFSFVRRPAYYATFTTGPKVTAQQRYGLGLLWLPGTGSVLQSQTGATGTAWGTRRPDTALVYEAADLPASFRVAQQTITTSPGNRDLPAGDLRVEYRLGVAGTKEVVFRDDGVHVAVNHAGSFTEQLPFLVLPTDDVTSSAGALELRRRTSRVTVRWRPASNAIVERTQERAGKYQVLGVAIPAAGNLRYDIEVAGASAATGSSMQRPASPP
jgi:hypothetical protein